MDRHQIKLKLKEEIIKAKLSTNEFRELFVSLFTKSKSYSADDNELAIRFFELSKRFYQFTKVRVGCALCSKSTEIGSVSYIKGLVIMSWKAKWICEGCKDEIREELYEEMS